jgi:hypothetical protein
MRSVIIILSVLIMITSARANTDNWQIILVNRDTISAALLVGIQGDSLCIEKSGLTQYVHVDSIAELRKPGYSRFRLGAAIGVVAGGVIGGVLGNERNMMTEGGAAVGILIGGAAGFALGGLIGSWVGQDEVYLISQDYVNTKRQTIRWLLSR